MDIQHIVPAVASGLAVLLLAWLAPKALTGKDAALVDPLPKWETPVLYPWLALAAVVGSYIGMACCWYVPKMM